MSEVDTVVFVLIFLLKKTSSSKIEDPDLVRVLPKFCEAIGYGAANYHCKLLMAAEAEVEEYDAAAS